MGDLGRADSPNDIVRNLPHDNRIESGSINIPVGVFPTKPLPKSFDPRQAAKDTVDAFNKALAQNDFDSVSGLFAENSYFRDHLALTWEFRTLKSPARISQFLHSHGQRLKSIELDDSVPSRAISIAPADPFGTTQTITFFIKANTDIGTALGVVRLIYDNDWKIFTLYTALQELTGFEEPTGMRRPLGASHGGGRNMKNWLEQRTADKNFEDSEPAVLILGAGQGGLASGARLRMLNVPTLIVDQEERVGDNWRQRYRQLVLHDPIWFDHLPYLEFPKHWPIFTPKDKLAEFFEAYVNLLELNVWTKTTITSTSWDSSKSRWDVTLERQLNGKIKTRTLHPRHIIQATGHSGKKNMPNVKGADTFKGRLCHSSEFPGAQANATGKKAVVVGACNSAHDIAQDYYENGYDVTIAQRSSTCVSSSASICDIALGGLYSEGAQANIPVDDADLLLWGLPAELRKAAMVQIAELSNEHDRATLEGLHKVGFQLDVGTDGSGLLGKYFQRGGGYYVDVGASQLIIEGKIKVKSGQEIAEVTPKGLMFADGSQLEADEIVFATGYQNMRTQTRLLFGDAIADQTQDVWGFNEEGEFRTMWQRSGHPGFWYMGGNLAISRFHTKFLALHIKALEEGLTSYPTNVPKL